MAKKKSAAKPKTTKATDQTGVTAERFSRLYKLVSFLGVEPKKRDEITAHLGLDVRGFYRDLDVLKAFGVTVKLDNGRYSLTLALDDALARMPYPDPHLTLGEMQQLAKGKSPAQKKLREQIDKLVTAPNPS